MEILSDLGCLCVCCPAFVPFATPSMASLGGSAALPGKSSGVPELRGKTKIPPEGGKIRIATGFGGTGSASMMKSVRPNDSNMKPTGFILHSDMHDDHMLLEFYVCIMHGLFFWNAFMYN